jgi:lipopolysaccharide/colanic/teichoic acid biosynthesis glycosyltransferase
MKRHAPRGDLSGLRRYAAVRTRTGTRVDRAVKRLIDVVGAGVLLILTLPLLAAAALAVLVTDGRPVFHAEDREGLGGLTLRVCKVRTMRRGADACLAEVLATDPARAEEFARYLCLRDDPRVLPGVGWLLRRCSIDELPQLVSVLLGHMSLVGPRPLPPHLIDLLPPEHLEMRRRVKPGLTGLWQVRGRSGNDVESWGRLDDRYVRSWSLWQDILILARTPAVLLSGRGAH